MAPTRQVSDQQLEILVQFAEENKLNRINGPLNHYKVNKAWEKVAQILNSTEEGCTKTALKWKRYWHLLKCRTKAKAADVRRSQSGTVGEPNKIVPLTELEQRIVRVIGNVVVVQPQHRTHTSSIGPTRIPTNVPNRKEQSVPRWVYGLEERRLAIEERLTSAVESISSTNEGILIGLQQIASTQVQLVKLLQERLNSSPKS